MGTYTHTDRMEREEEEGRGLMFVCVCGVHTTVYCWKLLGFCHASHSSIVGYVILHRERLESCCCCCLRIQKMANQKEEEIGKSVCLLG